MLFLICSTFLSLIGNLIAPYLLFLFLHFVHVRGLEQNGRVRSRQGLSKGQDHILSVIILAAVMSFRVDAVFKVGYFYPVEIMKTIKHKRISLVCICMFIVFASAPIACLFVLVAHYWTVNCQLLLQRVIRLTSKNNHMEETKRCQRPETNSI